MDSFTIACTGKTSILESKFFPPIQLTGKYQIGLKNFFSYNAIYNIKEPNNVLYYHIQYSVNILRGKTNIDKIKQALDKAGFSLIKKEGFGYNIISSDDTKYKLIENQPVIKQIQSAAFNEITLEDSIFYYKPNEKLRIVIPPGVYEISDIEKEIRKSVPNTFLKGDSKSLKCELFSPVIFDFNTEGFGRSLLGFRGMSKASTKIRSEVRVNINNTNVIRVHCNIVSGSYLNGKENHSVYDFYPSVPPGYKMIEVPSNIIYYPIDVDSISTFTVSFKDQNDELIDFNGEEVTVNFHIKKIG